MALAATVTEFRPTLKIYTFTNPELNLNNQ